MPDILSVLKSLLTHRNRVTDSEPQPLTMSSYFSSGFSCQHRSRALKAVGGVCKVIINSTGVSTILFFPAKTESIPFNCSIR